MVYVGTFLLSAQIKRVPIYSDPIAKPWNRIARPEQTEKWALRHTDTLVEGIRSSGVDVKNKGLASWFLSGGRGISAVAASFLGRSENALPDEKAEVRPASNFKPPASKTPHGDNRKTLRNMPLTLETFRLVSKRMSLHSWIGRLISRANVPAFERTLTEMPLYTSTAGGKSTMARQKAISE